MNINGKDVLLLSPSFYGYEKEISDKLGEMGANVTYINCDPSELFTTLMSSFERLGSPRSYWIRVFEKSIYKKISSSQFDYVLLISGWAITSEIIGKIKQNNLKPNGKMVLYYWDSLKRLKDDTKRWQYFDAIYTFDKEDYLTNKNTISFLPLFYCDKYWQKEVRQVDSDIMAIGSFRLNRLDYINKLQLVNPSLKIDKYLYSKRWVIIFHKTLRKKYSHVKYSDIQYKKLSTKEVVNLYSTSHAVLDIPAQGQSGLAIRTFETLAMHKKLITSNQDVATYDFYDPENIFIVTEDNLELPTKDWFQAPFSISDDVIKKYSIGSWLNTLIKNENF